MNILHISNYSKKGGAEIIFSITSNNSEHKNYLGFYQEDKIEQYSDIKFSSWEKKSFPFNIIDYIFSINNFRVLKNFLNNNKIDIIHLQGFFSSLSPSILLAIKIAKAAKKIRVIQTLHEFHLICPNASLYNFNKNQICEKCIGKKIKFNIFLENCDKRGLFYSIIKGVRSIISSNILKHKNVVDIFISPSIFLKEKIIEDGINPGKVRVIRNPIRINSFDELAKKEDIICYFGRFSYEKNIPFLITAFSEWKNKNPNTYRLILIGEGDEKQRILETIKNSHYKNAIEVKPFLDYNELITELNRCKIFSTASLCYENSPLAIAEAIALNIIPIAPSLGGMKESIEQIFKAGKTFSANDVSSWINCVNDVVNNYQVEAQKVRYAQEIVSNQFTITNYYLILNKLYNEIKEERKLV